MKCIFGFSLDLRCVTSSVRKVELRTHVHDVIMSNVIEKAAALKHQDLYKIACEIKQSKL